MATCRVLVAAHRCATVHPSRVHLHATAGWHDPLSVGPMRTPATSLRGTWWCLRASAVLCLHRLAPGGTDAVRRLLVVFVALAAALGLVAQLGTRADAVGSTGSTGSALREVHATTGTPAVYDDEAGGDADADDPAIWVNERDRSRSRVITTVKNAGLRVYDLEGRLVQSIAAPAAPGADDEPGRFNNVALVEGFRLAGRTVDLAVVSDRGRDQLRFYVVDATTGRLRDVTATDVPFAFSSTQAEVNEQATAYGLSTTTDAAGRAWAVVSRRHTATVGSFRIVAHHGRVTYRRTATLTLPTSFTLPDGTTWQPCEEPGEQAQVEGSVVDAANGAVYLGQEDVAVWRVGWRAGRFTGTPRTVERTQEYGVPATWDADAEECVADTVADPGYGGRIAADVEGLTIYPTGARTGTLLVSSQGDDTFYTYDRRTLRPVAHVAVTASTDGTVDGSQECDGADVVATALPGYPHGLLVVQDGHATPDVLDADGEVRTATHFLYVDAGFLRGRA